MRTLHLIDTTGPGGAETVFLDIAEHMHGHPDHSALCVINGTGWVQQQLDRREIPYIVHDGRKGFHLSYLWFLWRLIVRERIEIVHAHLLGAALYASVVSLVSRVSVVVTIHGHVDLSAKDRATKVKHRLLAVGVDALVAVSKHLARDLEDISDKLARRLSVIYNGLDLTRFTDEQDSSSTMPSRVECGLPASGFLIGLVGNVRSAKNYPLAIDVAAKLRERGKDIHIVIVGEGAEEKIQLLRERADEIGVANRVHFLGFVDDVSSILSYFDIYLSCSTTEGCSLALIEAMAARVPVVVTRSGGPEEIVTDQVTGLFANNRDASDIADNIERVLEEIDSAPLRRRLGNAHSSVVERFSLRTMVNEYEKLYLRLLDR